MATSEVEAALESALAEGTLGLARRATQECRALLRLAEAGAREGDPRWDEVFATRAAWGPLLYGLLDKAEGRLPPLMQALLIFALEPVDTTILVVLWGLAGSASLRQRAQRIERAWEQDRVDELFADRTDDDDDDDGDADADADADADDDSEVDVGIGSAPDDAADADAEMVLGHSAEFIVRLCYPDLRRQRKALAALRPQGSLRRFVLVRSSDVRSADPRSERFELDPDLASALLNAWRPPSGLEGVVRSG